ncbi:hypothetical protein B0J14DRAFT_595543 [Halenospora varia]|nr:hypothetical protein B0J14DRAFT_595543 [Halenospora varia]
MAPGLFHLFPRLSQELRDHVWRLALPFARVLEIRLVKIEEMGNGFQGNSQNEGYFWTTNTKSLATMLLVCREATAIVMASYEWTRIWTLNGVHRPCWTKTLVNYNEDVFYFSEESLGTLQKMSAPGGSDSLISPIQLKKMQIIAFPSNGRQTDAELLREFKPGRHIRKASREFLTRFIPLFTNMKTLILAVNCRDYRFSGDELFSKPPDELLHSGREIEGFELMSHWPESLVEDLVLRCPLAQGLKIKLSILINGESCEERARCMNFFRRCCRHVSRPMQERTQRKTAGDALRSNIPFEYADESSESDDSVSSSESESSLITFEQLDHGGHWPDRPEWMEDSSGDGESKKRLCCSIP